MRKIGIPEIEDIATWAQRCSAQAAAATPMSESWWPSARCRSAAR